MERVLLRAFDREIVEDGAQIEFRKRPSGAVVVALATFAVAAGVYGAGLALRSAGGEDPALAMFVMGAAGLMAIVGVLALAATAFLFAVPGRRVFARFDAGERTFRVRGREIAFAEIRRFSFLPAEHGMRSLCVETAGAGTMTVWMATRGQFEALEKLAVRLDCALAQGAGAAAADASSAGKAATAPVDQRFRTTVIVVAGIVWTVGGWFFFRGLSFTSRLDPDGLRIPVWCAGPAILVFAAWDWIKSRRR